MCFIAKSCEVLNTDAICTSIKDLLLLKIKNETLKELNKI